MSLASVCRGTVDLIASRLQRPVVCNNSAPSEELTPVVAIPSTIPLPRCRSISGTQLQPVPTMDGVVWTDATPTPPFHVIPTEDDSDVNFDSVSPETQRLKYLDKVVVPTIARLLTKQREAFIACLLSPIQLVLNTQFGKPDGEHVFVNDVLFRHVLYPLFCSGFLSLPCHRRLLLAFPSEVGLLHGLIADYGDVDFRPLQTQYLLPDWQTQLDLDHDRGRMMSACLLHYNGDFATVFRYVGGPCTTAYQDVTRILADIKPVVDDTTFRHVQRIYTSGSPAFCRAESTDANLRAAVGYGNHPTLLEDVAKTKKAVVKDAAPGFISIFDNRLIVFGQHAHVSPLGITELHHPYKKPRPYFDSSHRPTDDGYTINDWISTSTEPPLLFATALIEAYIWIWRLRACYPYREILLSDNDVAICFRRIPNHLGVVSMMLFIWDLYLFCYNRQSFGGNYCPANWEPIANAQRQMAIYLWSQIDTIDRTMPYLPPFEFPLTPSAVVAASFTRANLDTKNLSVFDAHGNRLPPDFPAWVDDALVADVLEHFVLGVCSSILALFLVVGMPDPTREPNPLSREKLDLKSTHERKYCGVNIDTRTLSVSMLPYKRELLLTELRWWIVPSAKFTLLEFAQITGLLMDHSKTCRWGWLYVYNILNQMRHTLSSRYFYLNRKTPRHVLEAAIKKDLPNAAGKRLDQLLSRCVAAILWQARGNYSVSVSARNDFKFLLDYLSVTTNQWNVSIGHLIPRDPFGESFGDASTEAGLGFVSHTHHFWCTMAWSAEIHHRIHLKHPDHQVHINQLEMVVYLMQLVAVCVASSDQSQFDPTMASRWANIPTAPQWQISIDNTVAQSWGERSMARSFKGQLLLRFQAALYYRYDVNGRPVRISTHDNVLADLLSRGLVAPVSHAAYISFVDQVFHTDERLKTYAIFHPRPELVSLLHSILCSSVQVDLTSLPERLGHFEPTGSTTFDGVTL